VFLGSFKSYELWISDAIFIMWIWPVFTLQFNFVFLGNHAKGELELISLCIYQFLPLPSALGLVWRIWIIASKLTLDHINVASIQLAIQFWVFGKSCKWRGRSNQFVYLPILAYSQRSGAHSKAMNYTFQMQLLSCECGQYSPCNSISGFWAIMQKESRTNQFMYLPIL